MTKDVSAAPGARARWREQLYTVVFEADRWPGRAFAGVLIALILLSIVTVRTAGGGLTKWRLGRMYG